MPKKTLPLETSVIGSIVVAFGNLELYLELGIWQLVAAGDELVRQRLEPITNELPFRKKVDAFVCLYRLRFPDDDMSELDALSAALSSAEQERNAIMHSAWSYSEEDDVFTRMKATNKRRRGFVRTLHAMPLDRISAVYDKLVAVGQQFGSFCLERVQNRSTADGSEDARQT